MTGTGARRVVVMTDDEDLLDEVVRLAAAAGVELERVPDAAGVRRRWHSAGLVLLDEAAARAVGPLRLGRRDGVVLLCRDEPPGTIWERAVGVGAEHVVSLPEGEDWLVGALADTGPAPESGPGRVVAVVGGRGGAGASVLAVAVAARAGSRGTRVLLVDCDPLGGGLDLVAGAEELEGLRWGGLALGHGGGGRVAAASLHEALPSPDGLLTVLSCDRGGAGPEPGAAVAVIEAGRRAGEIVVCDLPRHPTDTALAVADAADLVVLLVPAEVRAVAAATRVAEPLAHRGVPLRLVVRGPAPGGLDGEDVAHALGIDLLVSVAPEPGLAAALDRGRVPGLRRGPLQDAAVAVLDALEAVTERGRAA
ncbi:septum site-determining protein Ssd [Actinomycetospora cinnamomea]|uniref:Secretion/DNA translocation related CpaE-like protein n=1 Tax=Actinomycetospora cinnamomea TaxID=663609 RepID=A0A2U1FBN3_9PSEU|nr:septum site-determining protein Ssd [Actinomycetospora cinnamomea]PVZ09390.1 secretion/DNA translocation related CpaE-like protein [Actinomycetospora cinnamomea]